MQGTSVQNADVENRSDTTDKLCSPSIWKQMRDTESSVEGRPKFEIDLRVEEVPQDAIFKDEEQMKEMEKTFEKLKSGSCTNFIRDDMKKRVI